MKILITCLSASWGGLEMFSLTTAKQLLNKKVEVEYLSMPNTRTHQEAEKTGIKTHTFAFSNYLHPKETIRLAKLLRNENFSIIHSGLSKDLWHLVPALKLATLDTPLIITKHVGSFIIKKDFFHRRLYSRVNYAIAISSVIRKNLLDTTPLNEAKILLLYNGIDTKKFDPSSVNGSGIRKEFGIRNEELLIGMMGRFSPGKGHEEFLHAAKILLSKWQNIKFMVVGEASRGEDHYAAEIKSIASRLGITNKVIFTGYRNDTPEILGALDIFVFPSHAEAFGLTLVEAMSMSKPAVCSNSDAVLEIAVDNETAFLFENQNAVDLAEKIERLIISEELRKNFGSASRKRAVEMFDIEIYTDKLIEIYFRAAQKNNR